jgi:hypothetical protein
LSTGVLSSSPFRHLGPSGAFALVGGSIAAQKDDIPGYFDMIHTCGQLCG